MPSRKKQCSHSFEYDTRLVRQPHPSARVPGGKVDSRNLPPHPVGYYKEGPQFYDEKGYPHTVPPPPPPPRKRITAKKKTKQVKPPPVPPPPPHPSFSHALTRTSATAQKKAVKKSAPAQPHHLRAAQEATRLLQKFSSSGKVQASHVVRSKDKRLYHPHNYNQSDEFEPSPHLEPPTPIPAPTYPTSTFHRLPTRPHTSTSVHPPSRTPYQVREVEPSPHYSSSPARPTSAPLSRPHAVQVLLSPQGPSLPSKPSPYHVQVDSSPRTSLPTRSEKAHARDRHSTHESIFPAREESPRSSYPSTPYPAYEEPPSHRAAHLSLPHAHLKQTPKQWLEEPASHLHPPTPRTHEESPSHHAAHHSLPHAHLKQTPKQWLEEPASHLHPPAPHTHEESPSHLAAHHSLPHAHLRQTPKQWLGHEAEPSPHYPSTPRHHAPPQSPESLSVIELSPSPRAKQAERPANILSPEPSPQNSARPQKRPAPKQPSQTTIFAHEVEPSPRAAPISQQTPAQNLAQNPAFTVRELESSPRESPAQPLQSPTPVSPAREVQPSAKEPVASSAISKLSRGGVEMSMSPPEVRTVVPLPGFDRDPQDKTTIPAHPCSHVWHNDSDLYWEHVPERETGLECAMCFRHPTPNEYTKNFDPTRWLELNPKFYKYMPPQSLRKIPAAGRAIQHEAPFTLASMYT